MATNNITSHWVSVEVYLQSAVVRGRLVTRHDRLSSHLILPALEEAFTVVDASLEDVNGNPLVANSKEIIIYMQEVFLVADLSGDLRAGKPNIEQVQKEARKALLGVGPFWLRGKIHLIPGASVHDFVEVKSRFIPITDATLLNRVDLGPRTFLVNRSKIGSFTALDDS